MYCPDCGTEVPDDARFCTQCGSELAAASTQAPQPEPDTGEPLLTVKPVFLPKLTLAQLLPFQLFGTAWAAGFLGGFSMAGIGALKLNIPTYAPFVFWGVLAFIGIPALGYFVKKRTYEQTEYRFYRDRLEYTEGFMEAQDKRIKYENVMQTSMKRGVFQKMYKIGRAHV